MSEYEVVTADDYSVFKKLVQSLLDHDWKLAGGMSVAAIPFTHRDEGLDARVEFFQALTREKK